ncbi:MAG: hypothetical protein AB1894_18540 [Chloroflexota bacterium]
MKRLRRREDNCLLEWARLYERLDPGERQAMLGLIRAQMRSQMRRRRWQKRLSHLPRPRPTPAAMRLPLFHAAVSFACLGVLPRHPLAIPTALGAGLAAVILSRLLARCARKGEI